MRCLLTTVLLLTTGWVHHVRVVQAYTGQRYDGHQLVRVFPRTSRDLRVLKHLQNNRNLQIDFWRGPHSIFNPVDVLVSPEHNTIFQTLLKNNALGYKVSHPNIQEAINEQFAQSRDSPGSRAAFDFTKYHTYEQILGWLESMQNKHKDKVTLFTIGTTSQDRPMYTVKLSVKNQAYGAHKQAVWIDAGIHANEWAGPATLLYFIDQMLKNYGEDEPTTRLLDGLDWYILPIFNVDGYIYSWTEDRLWRKNRARHTDSKCSGVDLNRNWAVHWGEGANAAHDPCDRMYVGPAAMSEPEVRAVAQFLASQNGTVVAYLAYHSFGQLWMTPFSYSKTAVLPDKEQLMNISEAAVRAIERVHGIKYRYGEISQLVGEAAGASVDYTYQGLNITYSFGIELRDDGRYGTLLPTNQILPNAEESYAALHEVGRILLDQVPRDVL